jgi:bifunctional UDP-N-acetylglucosamine pyrophosphorylase/glucosamine-1-phosphate N-acetyltransferase
MLEHKTRAVVLAAGRSTRFKTKKSKLLFNVCGQSMIVYSLKALEALKIPMTLVLGYQADLIKAEVERSGIKDVQFVVQEKQLGTGHAVACSQDMWDSDDVLILNGDVPLLSEEIVSELIVSHKARNATVTFATAHVFNPAEYGRVVEQDGKIIIVEEKSCTEEQLSINLVNAGIYVMKCSFLKEHLGRISKNDATGEIFLTDLIKIAGDEDLTVQKIEVPFDNVRGVNTLQELWGVEQIKRSELIKHWMSNGVRFELAQSIHIDINVTIGAGSFIGTGVHLLGDTHIGEDCFVAAFSIVDNSKIGDRVNIHSHSVLQDSKVGNDVHVGPFARLRDNVVLGDNIEIGNFVEMKNTQMGDNSKTKHLTYLGDAKIGTEVNVGAGTIICNYDGVKKHTTKIEDKVFIGSNNTLIAPIKIGKGSYTAAGSTITNDVPSDALAIARMRQTNKEGYAKKILDAVGKRDDTESKVEKITSSLGDNNNRKSFRFRGAVKS